jgi:hypothetical protein
MTDTRSEGNTVRYMLPVDYNILSNDTETIFDELCRIDPDFQSQYAKESDLDCYTGISDCSICHHDLTQHNILFFQDKSNGQATF